MSADFHSKLFFKISRGIKTSKQRDFFYSNRLMLLLVSIQANKCSLEKQCGVKPGDHRREGSRHRCGQPAWVCALPCFLLLSHPPSTDHNAFHGNQQKLPLFFLSQNQKVSGRKPQLHRHKPPLQDLDHQPFPTKSSSQSAPMGGVWPRQRQRGKL